MINYINDNYNKNNNNFLDRNEVLIVIAIISVIFFFSNEEKHSAESTLVHGKASAVAIPKG
jgi:hypothetical protein